ncbi:MAG: type II toxin-antitoxin system RatA family toxin [Rhodospirillaceae bacterium]|nr:MAG: type II toxin-antitoxin system RatA family toxin [Rhodospirillaceae bacterium]
MPEHRESRVLPYTPAQMFNLVADVERYPEFLPWCVACRIASRQSPTQFTADLAVGFKMIREQFTSQVTLTPTSHIEVRYLKGPFNHLVNTWTFVPAGTPSGEGTKVDFFLAFEFRSRVLQAVIGALFEEAVRRMVAAFETRARHLYGSG